MGPEEVLARVVLGTDGQIICRLAPRNTKINSSLQIKETAFSGLAINASLQLFSGLDIGYRIITQQLFGAQMMFPIEKWLYFLVAFIGEYDCIDKCIKF